MDSRAQRRPSLPISVLLLLSGAVWAAALTGPRIPLPPDREPMTLRDRWETIQLGMTADQVRQRLGPPGGPDHPWVHMATHAEQWVVEDGRRVRHEWPPPWKLNWIDPGPTRTDPQTGRRYERWGATVGVACVVYGPDGRVDEKVWLEERPSPND
jgi:hypothetical protein